jgi:hypothetical protein
MELIHKTLEGASLFHRVQVFSLNIFDQREFKRLFIPNFPENGWNTKKLDPLSGAPPALTGNELVSAANFPKD